jgi:hypothetical protein
MLVSESFKTRGTGVLAGEASFGTLREKAKICILALHCLAHQIIKDLWI